MEYLGPSQNSIREKFINYINEIHFIEEESELIAEVKTLLSKFPIESFSSKPPHFAKNDQGFFEETYGELTINIKGYKEFILRYLYRN